MNDTRALLNRIADFRKRLEAMPRLAVPTKDQPDEPELPMMEPPPPRPEPASRNQAILEYSLRQLSGSTNESPPALSDRAKKLLIDAQGLVSRLRSLADEPLLAGPPPSANMEYADPLAAHYRETASLTEAAVRYAMTFPESAVEQRRLCEGLEGIIDAAHRRFDLLASALERRRIEESRLELLARYLLSVHDGDKGVDPDPLIRLADSILADELGRPLHLLHADPSATQGYLGGPEQRAPARFVAAHALNCAYVLARCAIHDAEWREHARELVLAGLLHDIGMLGVDPLILSRAGSLDELGRKAIDGHAHAGARMLVARVPMLSGLAEAVAGHHERADGSGYPARLHHEQISPMTRLISVIDAYVAICSPRPHRPAADPRAALTDVMMMADRGEFDRKAASVLLSLGLYPSGTVVELAGGQTAVVLSARDPRTAYQKAARPAVAVLTDENGRALPNPRYLDLADMSAGNVIRSLGQRDRLERLGRSYPEWV